MYSSCVHERIFRWSFLVGPKLHGGPVSAFVGLSIQRSKPRECGNARCSPHTSVSLFWRGMHARAHRRKRRITWRSERTSWNRRPLGFTWNEGSTGREARPQTCEDRCGCERQRRGALGESPREARCRAGGDALQDRHTGDERSCKWRRRVRQDVQVPSVGGSTLFGAFWLSSTWSSSARIGPRRAWQWSWRTACGWRWLSWSGQLALRCRADWWRSRSSSSTMKSFSPGWGQVGIFVKLPALVGAFGCSWMGCSRVWWYLFPSCLGFVAGSPSWRRICDIWIIKGSLRVKRTNSIWCRTHCRPQSKGQRRWGLGRKLQIVLSVTRAPPRFWNL